MMAVFLKGNISGVHFKVSPLGWRKIFPVSFVFPYFVGNKIDFRIQVTKYEEGDNTCLLNTYTIFEAVPGREQEYPRKMENLLGLDDKTTHCEITDGTKIAEEGYVAYWLGAPGNSDSNLLISTEIFHYKELFSPWSIVSFFIGVAIALFICQ